MALADQQAELGALLAPLDETGWARPSPCEGWSVADVVLHLAQTNEMAIASATDRLDDFFDAMLGDAPPASDVDDGAAVMVERERGLPDDELLARWRRGSKELVDRLSASDPRARVTWVAGQLTVRTLATTRLAETWIHSGDVADALAVELAPTDRLWHIARLAWRTLPYAFARDGRELQGPVAFDLQGPSGDEWRFEPDEPARTVVRGPAYELCRVAARRLDPASTSLQAEGPDADAVLALVRTYA